MTLDPLNPYHLELAIIASTVLDPDVLRQPEIRALTPRHLRHLGGAWAIIREMDHAGRDIDLFSLAQQLHDPRWPAQLGVAQLTGLAAYSIRPQELASAAQGILNAHRRDLALSVAAGLQRNLTDAETDHGAAITQATADLNALRGLALQDASESVTDDLSAAMARIMNPRQHRGPTTGLPTLDAILGGWQPKTLNILSARPSMGKSALLGQFAQAASYGDPSAPARVLMFSLEDGREITRMRTLARLSGVEIRHDETPGADAAQRLRNAAANMERHLRGGRWLIDEEARLDNIIQTAWRQHAQSPLGLVIVDQLSHVTTDAPRRQADNRTQLYGYITKTLKREVAQRLGVPVILACQLSRESTKREKQRPELTDLRDSGEIEQDADTVTFIHRPEYYDAADAPGRAELLVKKNRNGPTKTAVVSCNMKLFKFWEGAP